MYNTEFEKTQLDESFFTELNDIDGEISVDVEILANKHIRVFGVPDGDDNVTVTLRPVSMKDFDLIQFIQSDPKEGLYRMLAALIIDWGSTGKIDCLRLKTAEKEEAVMLLDQICQRFCLRRYKFNVRRKSKGFQNDSISFE